MRGDCGFDLVGGVTVPIDGARLRAGVGEEVAIVEIDENVEALIVGPDGFRENVGLVAPSAVSIGCGVDPDSESDGVHADGLHECENVGSSSGRVIEFFAVGFHFGAPTDVGTASERC